VFIFVELYRAVGKSSVLLCLPFVYSYSFVDPWLLGKWLLCCMSKVLTSTALARSTVQSWTWHWFHLAF